MGRVITMSGGLEMKFFAVVNSNPVEYVVQDGDSFYIKRGNSWGYVKTYRDSSYSISQLSTGEIRFYSSTRSNLGFIDELISDVDVIEYLEHRGETYVEAERRIRRYVEIFEEEKQNRLSIYTDMLEHAKI
jgi:hypothetical protein